MNYQRYKKIHSPFTINIKRGKLSISSNVYLLGERSRERDESAPHTLHAPPSGGHYSEI